MSSPASGMSASPMRPPSMPSMPSTPSMPATPTTPAGLPTPATAASDLSQGFTKGLAASGGTPMPPSVPTTPNVGPTPPPAVADAAPASTPASAPPPAASSSPVASAGPAHAPAGAQATPGPMIAAPPAHNLSAFGSDMQRPGTPPAPTVSAAGPSGAPATPGTTSAGVSSTSVPPSVLATSGVAATGTGAAMVSSETQDQHLDDAVQLAYELLHASRIYPGLHWCVGIFKTATGTETVITSDDGASYIPPGVYVPRSARVLFADPELATTFQTKWFGWVNPAATMVAYATEHSALDPNIELYAVAATTDPGGSSVLPARRAGVPHYQDCDSTRSPLEAAAPAPELDDSRLHRLAVIAPAMYEQLTDANTPATQHRATAWDATAGAVATALAGAEPLRVEVAPVIREILGALASGTPITDEQWSALGEVRLYGKSLFMRPGFIEVEPSTDPTGTALYRAHHNLDRAVEALSLWRGDNPDYAEIVYATEQISKEEQLWPVAISS
ncbi:MAG: methyl-accepting chemotaxis sensory transducer [Mycobacterium sp.]